MGSLLSQPAQGSIAVAAETVLDHSPKQAPLSVTAVLRLIGRHLASLLWSVNPRARISVQFPTDGELVPIKHIGYLRFIVSGFHEGVNLISFSLAEVFVGH